jgi:HEPN domain-containing protein
VDEVRLDQVVLPSHRRLVPLPPKDESLSGVWAEVAVEGIVLFERELIVSRQLVRIRQKIAAGTIPPPSRARSALLGGGGLMRNLELARDYVRRAEVRLLALDVLYRDKSWADVVGESQKIVELTLKGLLRSSGITPPRIHDVSDLLVEERGKLPEELWGHLEELTRISRKLRRDRELAFYGAEDLTPPPDGIGAIMNDSCRPGDAMTPPT